MFAAEATNIEKPHLVALRLLSDSTLWKVHGASFVAIYDGWYDRTPHFLKFTAGGRSAPCFSTRHPVSLSAPVGIMTGGAITSPSLAHQSYPDHTRPVGKGIETPLPDPGGNGLPHECRWDRRPTVHKTTQLFLKSGIVIPAKK